MRQRSSSWVISDLTWPFETWYRLALKQYWFGKPMPSPCVCLFCYLCSRSVHDPLHRWSTEFAWAELISFDFVFLHSLILIVVDLEINVYIPDLPLDCFALFESAQLFELNFPLGSHFKFWYGSAFHSGTLASCILRSRMGIWLLQIFWHIFLQRISLNWLSCSLYTLPDLDSKFSTTGAHHLAMRAFSIWFSQSTSFQIWQL